VAALGVAVPGEAVPGEAPAGVAAITAPPAKANPIDFKNVIAAAKGMRTRFFFSDLAASAPLKIQKIWNLAKSHAYPELDHSSR